jgi:hypothetical protein
MKAPSGDISYSLDAVLEVNEFFTSVFFLSEVL